jgi:hypothetical protein
MRTQGAKGGDTLPDEAAAKVREVIRRARDLKGLRNRDLALHLTCDERTVTSVFESAKPLRLGATALGDLSGKKDKKRKERGVTAPDLIRTICKLRPRRDGKLLRGQEAWAIEGEVRSILAPALSIIANIQYERWPVALIATHDYRRLATWLADRIVKKPGFSARKRSDLERTIASIFAADARRFAFAAWQQLIAATAPLPAFSSRTAQRVLARFGHELKVNAVDTFSEATAKRPSNVPRPSVGVGESSHDRLTQTAARKR